MKIKCGIYKITSPVGRVYIGQSHNIYKRWSEHKWPKKKSRGVIRLENSVKKYGWKNHLFEIIHELPLDVDQSIIDAYEILYTEQHIAVGSKMLNIKIGGMGGKHSEETKEIQKIKSTGRKHSTETKKLIGQRNKGHKVSDAGKLKISIANKGRVVTEATKQKLREASPHRKLTIEHIEKLKVASTSNAAIENRKQFWKNLTTEEKELRLAHLKPYQNSNQNG